MTEIVVCLRQSDFASHVRHCPAEETRKSMSVLWKRTKTMKSCVELAGKTCPPNLFVYRIIRTQHAVGIETNEAMSP